LNRDEWALDSWSAAAKLPPSIPGNFPCDADGAKIVAADGTKVTGTDIRWSEGWPKFGFERLAMEREAEGGSFAAALQDARF
jgi:hypothetical protein